MNVGGINWDTVMRKLLPALSKSVDRMDVRVDNISISCYRVGEIVRIDIKDTDE